LNQTRNRPLSQYLRFDFPSEGVIQAVDAAVIFAQLGTPSSGTAMNR